VNDDNDATSRRTTLSSSPTREVGNGDLGDHEASDNSDTEDEPLVDSRQVRRAAAAAAGGVAAQQSASDKENTVSDTVAKDGEETEGVYKEKERKKAQSDKRQQPNTSLETKKRKEFTQPEKSNAHTIPDGTTSRIDSPSPPPSLQSNISSPAHPQID